MKRILIMLSLLSLCCLHCGCADEIVEIPETTLAEQTSAVMTVESISPPETEAERKLISVSFENIDPVRVTTQGTYPRLYKLMDEYSTI